VRRIAEGAVVSRTRSGPRHSCQSTRSMVTSDRFGKKECRRGGPPIDATPYGVSRARCHGRPPNPPPSARPSPVWPAAAPGSSAVARGPAPLRSLAPGPFTRGRLITLVSPRTAVVRCSRANVIRTRHVRFVERVRSWAWGVALAGDTGRAGAHGWRREAPRAWRGRGAVRECGPLAADSSLREPDSSQTRPIRPCLFPIRPFARSVHCGAA
jgi:hypothetical protein